MKGNSTSVKKISKFLRDKITSNLLKPGEHLCEKTLANEFGISRVPVRESLRILQSEGYLDFIPNKGCYVKKVSSDFFNQTAIVYILLAPVVLEKAIPNYTEKTFKKAESIIERIEKSSNTHDVGYLLWDFATVIYSPSHMKFMMKVFDSIYQYNIRLLNEFFKDGKISKFNVSAHREFISLCRQNKPEEAIKSWNEFLAKLVKLIIPA